MAKTLRRIVRRVSWQIKHKEKVEEREQFVQARNGGLGKDERLMYLLLMNKLDGVGLIDCFRYPQNGYYIHPCSYKNYNCGGCKEKTA